MSAQTFGGGYSILPPILSAQNSQEDLDIAGKAVDINSNNVNKSGNLNSNTELGARQCTRGSVVEIPNTPFSSILQQTQNLKFDTG